MRYDPTVVAILLYLLLVIVVACVLFALIFL